MFGLFSKSKGKEGKSKPEKPQAQSTKPAAKQVSGRSEALRAELFENMRTARENIGEETLERIAAAMTEMQNPTSRKQNGPFRRLTQIVSVMNCFI